MAAFIFFPFSTPSPVIILEPAAPATASDLVDDRLNFKIAAYQGEDYEYLAPKLPTVPVDPLPRTPEDGFPQLAARRAEKARGLAHPSGGLTIITPAGGPPAFSIRKEPHGSCQVLRRVQNRVQGRLRPQAEPRDQRERGELRVLQVHPQRPVGTAHHQPGRRGPAGGRQGILPGHLARRARGDLNNPTRGAGEPWEWAVQAALLPTSCRVEKREGQRSCALTEAWAARASNGDSNGTGFPGAAPGCPSQPGGAPRGSSSRFEARATKGDPAYRLNCVPRGDFRHVGCEVDTL